MGLFSNLLYLILVLVQLAHHTLLTESGLCGDSLRQGVKVRAGLFTFTDR